MQQPEIQFTTTDDDVTIAYWSVGAGPPLLITQNFVLNHVDLEWTVPSIADLYEALAEQYRLIRFNPRGGGMSERRPSLDYSTAGMGLDIGAVLDAVGVDEATLLGSNTFTVRCWPSARASTSNQPARRRSRASTSRCVCGRSPASSISHPGGR